MRRIRSLGLRKRMIGLLLIGVIGLVAILSLSLNVSRELRLLNSASSDNVQWTLSQVEVEFLKFEVELEAAASSAAPSLNGLRRAFDVFYSRIRILRSAPIYAGVREKSDFIENITPVQQFLDDAVPLMDGDDTALLAALPALNLRARGVEQNVRSLSISGLTHFAEESDLRRTGLSLTLIQLATGVALLLLLLMLLALYLWVLNGQNIRRRAEAVAASKRTKIVTSTALDAVIVADDTGTILDFNEAAEQIFGHDAKDAIGRELGELIVPDHHRAAHDAGMERMRAKGEKHVVGAGRVKLEAKRANGEVFPVELAIQSAETETGEIFIAFLRDISHRVKSEAELVRARDLALASEKAKTDFLATMSHEIRTPLNGLLGNLTLLETTRLSAKQARYVKNMNTSGKLLMSHVSDVLDITKYDAGKLVIRSVPLNLSVLLQDIVDNQSGTAMANETTLEWGWTGPVVNWIKSDQDLIQHILMNVVGNAVKFTRHGKVSVRVMAIGDGDAQPELQIDVHDTGIGMEPELKSRIFDDFVTGDASYGRTSEGTGLGLGIAQRFVKALGGTIAVESQLGKGSQFSIRFPITPIAAPTSPFAEPLQSGKARKGHVLLVEDNEINRVLAREMLVAAGHKVTEAHDGQSAVSLALAQRFDLILMDISMPVMDGRSATRAIRSGQGASADVPIIALTANAVAEEQVAFLSDGMNDIMTKPLSRDMLVQLVQTYVSGTKPPVAMAPAEKAAPRNPQLDDLRATLGDELLEKLLNSFEQEIEQALQVLSNHASHPPETIIHEAHRMAGSASAIGAMEMRSLFLQIEAAAKAGDSAKLEQNIAALPASWAAIKPQLRAYR